MCAQKTFKTMHESLINALIASGKLVNVQNYMMKDNSEEDITNYFIRIPEVVKHIKVDNLLPYEKEPINAIEWRQTANRFYKSGQYKKALDMYNKSIVLSVVKPNFKDSKSIEEECNLALCYSNRSSVAFEYGLYENCLKDISRAIEHGHPLRLRSKLIARRAKCLMAGTKSFESADTVLGECLEELNNLKLEDSVMKECRSSLGEVKSSHDVGSIIQKEHPDKKYFIIPPAEVPVIPYQNPKVPSLSNAVRISFSSDKGRMLVANRDINPGEPIFNDQSFASAVEISHRHTHCSNCMKRTFFPIPCPMCTMVIFCGEECRDSALDTFHKFECKILPTLDRLDEGMGGSNLLVLRMVTKVGLEYLKKHIPIFKKEAFDNSDPSKLGFDEQSMYLSQEYRTMFHLTTNKQARDVAILCSSAILAYQLLILLDKTSFFGEDKQQLKKNRKLLYQVLFHFVMVRDCNVFYLNETSIDDYNDEDRIQVAHGLSGLYGLLNHSCDPNTSRFCFDNTIVSRAMKPIRRGDEITDCYGMTFTLISYDTRQEFLKQKYQFSCKCEACLGRWPIYEDLPDNLSSVVKGKVLLDLVHRIGKCETLDEKLHSIDDKEINEVVQLMCLLCRHVPKPSCFIFRTQYLLHNIYDRKVTRYLKHKDD